jgi:hypothetical protein
MVVGEASVRKVQSRIAACQNCSSSVFRTFAALLAETLGETAPISQFCLGVPAHCPSCSAQIHENTWVRSDGEEGFAGFTADTLPGPEERRSTPHNVVLVDEATLMAARAFVTGCRSCAPHATMTFEYLLDAVTDGDPTITEYVMGRPVACPRCGAQISEKTLVVADP